MEEPARPPVASAIEPEAPDHSVSGPSCRKLASRRSRQGISAGTTAVLVASGLLLVGCTSSGTATRSQPLTAHDLDAAVLSAQVLSSPAREALRSEGLAPVGQRATDAAIGTLAAELSENPSRERRLALAELCSDRARRATRQSTATALGYYLAAAETAWPGIATGGISEEQSALRTIYNHSVGQVVEIVYRGRYDRGTTLSIEGPWQTYRLSLAPPRPLSFDPDYVDRIEVAQYLDVTGVETRHVRTGIGAALVGHRKQTPERVASQPFLAPVGMAFPITATLDFRGGGDVQVVLHDALVADRVSIDGKSLPLAADFTAPLATLADFRPEKNIGWSGMLRPEDYMDQMGLYEVDPYRPDRIPVILVHGLMSSPETWLEAANTLRADPVIRKNYRFLAYLYPTGFPIPYNGAGLRRHLARYVEHYDPDRRDPRMRRIVMMGHSMGGLLTSMQIRSSGDEVWNTLFDTPLAELDVSDEQREILRELVYFQANPDIERAVFLAAPHRGSEMASASIGQFGSQLIKLSLDSILLDPELLLGDATSFGQSFLVQRSDSIIDLQDHSETLEKILGLPIGSHVSFHSIIGDRGKGNTPESTDGVVPYWSSHLDGAESEAIVPEGHNLTRHPETIEEMRRILYLHIGR